MVLVSAHVMRKIPLQIQNFQFEVQASLWSSSL